MERKVEGRIIRENGIRKLSAVLLTGSLAIAGCGSDKAKSNPNTAQSLTPAKTQTGSSAAKGVELVFDDLNGGSSIIRVYPGVTKSKTDMLANGTYNDGDTVPAECKTEGRSVHSDPSVGETNRTSSEWIRIHGTPGETQYATAVYVENPQAVLKQLPDC
jgi:hypothetical protein